LAAALGAVGLRIVEHGGADGGIGTSLAAGVAAAPDAAGWLIALGDMPWVQPETISALTQALARGASLVAPLHAGRRGHPVGFAALWRDQLLNLKGDQGARDLIAAQAGQLLLLPTEDPGVLLDVDTPADFPSLRRCPSLHRSAV
jgi:molybdenum cofactor cytidylyltransferase